MDSKSKLGERAEKNSGKSRTPSEADCKKMQNDLLDEALLETFPASDPISVVRPQECP